MLQSNLSRFLDRMQDHFQQIQIESNGLLLQEDLPDAVTLVVSPKCAETKAGKVLPYKEPMRGVLDRADCLKFVMSADPDSPYSSIPDWAFRWKERMNSQIFISPMNVYNREPERARKLRAERQGKEITLDERSDVDEVISFWEPGLLDMEANKANHEYAARYVVQQGLRMGVQLHLLASLA